MAPLWGPWTDRGGKRKPALQAAILGACLELTVALLVMYFHWSVYVLFVSAAISGFSGFATVLLVGATSYIVDSSTQEERAFRIGEKMEPTCFLHPLRSVVRVRFLPGMFVCLSFSNKSHPIMPISGEGGGGRGEGGRGRGVRE